MKSLEEWLDDNKNTIFRFLVYKKVFTPYEQDKKFSDESMYEDGGFYKFGQITDIIKIPNDILLEMKILIDYDEFGPFTDINQTQYYKLSEIRLLKNNDDQREIQQENDEDSENIN